MKSVWHIKLLYHIKFLISTLGPTFNNKLHPKKEKERVREVSLASSSIWELFDLERCHSNTQVYVTLVLISSLGWRGRRGKEVEDRTNRPWHCLFLSWLIFPHFGLCQRWRSTLSVAYISQGGCSVLSAPGCSFLIIPYFHCYLLFLWGFGKLRSLKRNTYQLSLLLRMPCSFRKRGVLVVMESTWKKAWTVLRGLICYY